jgi:hypothetical protein
MLNLVWYGNIVGELLLLGRLIILGFVPRYKWFVAYLSVSGLRDIALIIVTKLNVGLYLAIWEVTEVLTLILLTATVFEAFLQVTRSFPNLGTLGRTTLKVGLAIGGVVTVILAIVEAGGYGDFWYVFKRCVTAILAVFLICVDWVFLWVRVSTNTVRHCRILTVFCSVSALSYFSLHLGLSSHATSIAVLSGSLVCFMLWLIFIKPAGERLRLRDIPREDAERALVRLKEIKRWLDSLRFPAVRLPRSCRVLRRAAGSLPLGSGR